jgi:hypothetical protein
MNNTRVKDCDKDLCQWTEYEVYFGHYIGNGCILVDSFSQLTELPAVSHQRPTSDVKLHTHMYSIRITNCDHNS